MLVKITGNAETITSAAQRMLAGAKRADKWVEVPFARRSRTAFVERTTAAAHELRKLEPALESAFPLATRQIRARMNQSADELSTMAGHVRRGDTPALGSVPWRSQLDAADAVVRELRNSGLAGATNVQIRSLEAAGRAERAPLGFNEKVLIGAGGVTVPLVGAALVADHA